MSCRVIENLINARKSDTNQITAWAPSPKLLASPLQIRIFPIFPFCRSSYVMSPVDETYTFFQVSCFSSLPRSTSIVMSFVVYVVVVLTDVKPNFISCFRLHNAHKSSSCLLIGSKTSIYRTYFVGPVGVLVFWSSTGQPPEILTLVFKGWFRFDCWYLIRIHNWANEWVQVSKATNAEVNGFPTNGGHSSKVREHLPECIRYISFH